MPNAAMTMPEVRGFFNADVGVVEIVEDGFYEVSMVAQHEILDDSSLIPDFRLPLASILGLAQPTISKNE